MLQSLPGYSHLKILSPARRHSSALPTTENIADASIRACLQIVLDIACGVRDITAIPRGMVDPKAKIHLRAFLKATHRRGPVCLQRIDVHRAPIPVSVDPLAIRIASSLDVVGTYRVVGTTQAFAARIDRPEGKRQWIVRSLRLF